MNTFRASAIRGGNALGAKADILMTTDTIGGVWSYSLELARALDRFDLRILIATMGARPTRSQRNDVEELRNADLVESDFKLEWMDDPWQDIERSGHWLLAVQSEWRPSIIHLNSYAHASLEWRVPVIVVAHSCVLSWWRAVHGADAPIEWNDYRKAVARGLTRADAVVAPSHAMLNSLYTLYGCPRRSYVIFNGRRDGLFRTERKRDYVLAAGRVWDQAKNFGALDGVAASLPWPVYLAGSLDQNGAAEQPSLANVTPLGNLSSEQMKDWLAFASVFAHPVRYEPFGLAPLEAALSGCALVLGDIPSLRELWDGAALFVPPDNREMLRHAIARLIDDLDFRLTLARAARQRALNFSSERMAAAYFQLYNAIAEDRFASGRRACA